MSNNIDELFDDFAEAKEFWLNKIQNISQEIIIPYDYKDSNRSNIKAISKKLDQKITNRINSITNDNDLTLYIYLLSILNILIYKYTNQDEIIIASPVYTESDELYEFNKYIFFIENLKSSIIFKDFLIGIKDNVLEVFNYQYYDIQKHLKMFFGPQQAFSPFRIFFLLENIHKVDLINEVINQNNNNLVFSVKKENNEIELSLTYNSGWFSQNTINQMINCYFYIIEQILRNSNLKISEIEAILPDEKNKVLTDFNSCNTNINNQLLHQLFENTVDKGPDHIAVSINNQNISYLELNNKANQLANYLRKNDVKPDDIVGVLMNVSIDMIISLLAILKCGAAYLPIDLELPRSRVQFMLKDSNVQFLLVNNSEVKKSGYDCTIVNINNKDIEKELQSNPEIINSENNLAYIIYTSGSTGNPKGVLIEHKSIVNSLSWRKSEYQFNHNDRVLVLFSYSFDGFITSFFTPIISNSTVFLLENYDMRNIESIINTINNNNITHFISTPSLFLAILDHCKDRDLKSLRIVTLAGEELKSNIIKKSKQVLPELEIVNEYGPTENSVVTTFQRDVTVNELIRIGKPCSNTKVYIINDDQLAPIGVYGELCISGRSLAKGYLNNDQLTKEKFIKNNFDKEDSDYSVLYKTGDIARWLNDGTIEYYGRKDNQVKIRGYRIEITEVINTILSIKGIKDAIVISNQDENDIVYLIAYVIKDEILTEKEIKDKLYQLLPIYAVPAFIIAIDAIPTLMNGKIDKKALPKPTQTMIDIDYVKPNSKLEKELAGIWAEILKVKRVGINSKFMDIGGNSILLMYLFMRLEKMFPDIPLSIPVLYAYPTISKFIEYIEENTTAKDKIFIQSIKFPENLLHSNKGVLNTNTIYNYTIDNSLFDCLNKISQSENFSLEVIIIGFYIKYLNYLTQLNKLPIYIALNENNHVHFLDIELDNNIKSYKGLFDEIKRNIKQNNQYSINQLDHNETILNKAKISLLLKNTEINIVSDHLYDQFNLIFEMNLKNNSVELCCQYNSQKLNSNNMKDFFNDFIGYIHTTLKITV